jgi:hypothetical protein
MVGPALLRLFVDDPGQNKPGEAMKVRTLAACPTDPFEAKIHGSESNAFIG